MTETNLVQNLSDLNSAKMADPFSFLGKHQVSKTQWLIRTWQLNADKVELLGWHSDSVIASFEKADDGSLFEITTDLAECYRLKVHYGDKTFIKHDPYQFPDLRFNPGFFDAARVYYHEGAHLVNTTIDGIDVHGVRFSVYAPNARSISIVGDFNHWDGRAHPMQSSGDGIWRLFIPNVEVGQGYKYEIKSASGEVLPHKIDPFAFSVDQFPSFASRIYDHNHYQWQDQSWQNREKPDYLAEPMSIYEVHLGSWRRDSDRPLTYQQFIDQLIPYVKDMGYTHIELLPITEFPFDGSWGYQPVGLYAPTSRYGNPDEFKAFIDACHANDIGVILDWVPAHFPTDAHGLANFDGTPLYEYEDPKKGWHQDWNSLIYDYGREHVCRFLISNAMYWFEHFHIDGIRVDAVASMLYLDYARDDGQWIPNVDGGNENYEAISFLKRLNESIYLNFPNALTIAEESTAFAGVSKPTFEGGLGFGFKWNMGWMNDGLEYMQKEHVHRKYHHGEMTFSMIYAFDEHFVLPLSHDEVVHGKGSLLDKMPGDGWQKFANLRAYMGYMYAHPGKKLNFMGSELAQGREWNHDDSLDWHLLDIDLHKGQQALIRDLNALYTSNPSLYEQDYNGEGFCWLVGDDAENSIMAMARFAKDRDQHLLAITNFTPVPRQGYRIGVPQAGQYRVALNSDSPEYGGSDFNLGGEVFVADGPACHGQEQSIMLDIPPLATVFLQPK